MVVVEVSNKSSAMETVENIAPDDISCGSEPPSANIFDCLYSFSEINDKKVRDEKLWTQSAAYFTDVLVNSTAAIKMVQHALSGVKKGREKNGMPIEIMGLILGRPATEDDVDSTVNKVKKETIIVMDALPLPVEGTETRCLADDHEISMYMIKLAENMEQTREERVIGWYHSHPFDYNPEDPKSYNHAFLSGVDVQTQWMWQNMEDGRGNPWLALVVDPLTTINRNVPEIGAFRVKQHKYRMKTISPDGKPVTRVNEAAVIKRYGEYFDAFYALKVVFFSNSFLSTSLESFLGESKILSDLTRFDGDAFSIEKNEEETEILKDVLKISERAKGLMPGKIMMGMQALGHRNVDLGQLGAKRKKTEKKEAHKEKEFSDLHQLQQKLAEIVETRETNLEVLKLKRETFPNLY